MPNRSPAAVTRNSDPAPAPEPVSETDRTNTLRPAGTETASIAGPAPSACANGTERAAAGSSAATSTAVYEPDRPDWRRHRAQITGSRERFARSGNVATGRMFVTGTAPMSAADTVGISAPERESV